MITTVSKDIAALSYNEFKAFIEKIQSSGALPDVVIDDLYVSAGGVLPKKAKVKTGGE
jgi:hypothetical protein